jgi:hypothetical protein
MLPGAIYINLDHRTDRRKLAEDEFDRLGIPEVRFPAIHNKDGRIGCIESHLTILKSDLTNVTWVCEDDIEFLVDRDTLDTHINEFLKSKADILCLGFANRRSKNYSDNLMRSFDVQTTSSYIIKPSFKPILIDLWSGILDSLKTGKPHPLEGAFMKLNVHKGDFLFLDQSWKLLQQSHVFVIPKIRCVKQRASFSDIEKEYVDYGL